MSYLVNIPYYLPSYILSFFGSILDIFLRKIQIAENIY